MRLKYLIKVFRFEEDNRSKITLGTSVRLHPTSHWLQLEADADGSYPEDPDLYAKSWVANPTSAKAWAGFQAEYQNVKIDGAVVTAVRFRLSDGTDDYWWDGSQWDNAPAAGEWNTDAEISEHIPTFPVTDKKIQVIVNLETDDPSVTPIVQSVKILYQADIEFKEDIVFRSLVRSLREEVRPIADYLVKKKATGATLDLANDYPLKTPYNITGIDAAFNHTDDPDHETDIFQSWDPGTQTITLTGSVDADKKVWIRFTWEPEIIVTTSQDYTELRKIPCVVVEDIRLDRASEIGLEEHVLNKHNGQGKKLPSPLRADIIFGLRGITDKSIDLFRLADELKRYFANNTVLRSRGTDEEYRLWLESEFDMTGGSPAADLRYGVLRARIVDVLFFERDPVDVYAVQRLNLTGDMDVVVEN